jgi:hypothetical protein
MKKSACLVSCASILALGALSANAEEAEPTHCSQSTLHGTMAWSATTWRAANPGLPGGTSYTGSGQESYDGKGGMKYYEFYSDGTNQYTYSGTATYTVSETCIATVTYDSETVPWVYFVSADGEHYYWNNNQGIGELSAGRADRITKALLVK